MRIGIMMRASGEKGGIGLYTRNVVAELLRLDKKNQYILFYGGSTDLGLFSTHKNVTERSIPLYNKALWDQIAIPWACYKERLDLIFHPKFTAPLLAPCPVVMTVHGADWFVPDQARYYSRLDVLYMKLLTPLYLRKCTSILSVSELTTRDFYQYFHLPPDKMKTVYLGAARHFRQETNVAQLQAVRKKYGLPEHFIFTITKRSGDDRKNLKQVFMAYAQYHQRAESPCKLVIAGKDCHFFRQDYALPDVGYGADIIFTDWIDQPDLPAVYTQAKLYLYPSNLEAFPVPIVEAMSCGTPIVTSNANGLVEIAGDAALYVDPQDTDEITRAIERVLEDTALQAELSQKGLKQAQLFNWEECARETLAILEKAA